MYKFTNGIVVFDKKTKDEYVKSGMILVQTKEDKLDNGKESSKTEFINEKHEGSDRPTSKHKK